MGNAINWYEMSVSTQLANVGGEVIRAISWKNKGNINRAIGFCNKAIELLDLIKRMQET